MVGKQKSVSKSSKLKNFILATGKGRIRARPHARLQIRNTREIISVEKGHTELRLALAGIELTL
jgi:hypothetical protein